MANGCISTRITKEAFEKMTTDEKMVCFWEVITELQADVSRMKRWLSPEQIIASFVGGALMILILIMFGVKVIL